MERAGVKFPVGGGYRESYKEGRGGVAVATPGKEQ